MYLPPPSTNVSVICFHISLMNMMTPHRKNSLSERLGKETCLIFCKNSILILSGFEISL